ncbi:Inositol-pentakisphosphate 2-kinase [Candida viswanathii]|uniref:Inositol-pentakisphosphate 2-kinase n=1 Tax=Candida viswanathii TaxID=5486 RepID=A0A367Y2N9_9ASCO|nr:Inositol-pentakisphosphate 2-kinase [Candida viswanathii]
MEISKITEPEDWEYFAKGAANILFKYIGTNDYLKHKLLRIRLLKEEQEYISTCELYDFIELKCKNLFPHQIIDIQLIVLTSDFINKLNNQGHDLMLRERYGLLLPNILDGNYEELSLSKKCQLYYERNQENDGISSVIFEIKPKWLYDNYNSNYCRTCSLNQLKHVPRHFCPLDLLYPETIDQGLQDLFLKIPAEILAQIEKLIPLKKLFKIYLNNEDNVFQQLRKYQKINNKNDLIENLTSSDDVSQNLSLIMTLRDVGLFLKFEKFNKDNHIHTSHNNVNNVYIVDGQKFLLTCNIYDLDLKSKMKYKYWLKVENDLQLIYNSSNPDWRYCTKYPGITNGNGNANANANANAKEVDE